MNTETADEALVRCYNAFFKWAAENDMPSDQQDKYWDCWLEGFLKGFEETFSYRK